MTLMRSFRTMNAAPQIVFDSASSQVWTGNRVRDRALLRNDADVFCAIDKNLVPRQQPVAFVETRSKVVEKFFELGDKAFWEIADLSAHARVGCGEPGARQKLEQVIQFFTLSERVEKDRHSAEIERHRAQPEEMRGNARCFAANRADGFSARRNVPIHQFFHRERVRHIIRQRREIIEPVGIRHELIVLHVLGDLLVAAMKKTDIRRGFGDDLTVQLQHEPQNAVRGWMRWPHVEHHLLANIIVALLA